MAKKYKPEEIFFLLQTTRLTYLNPNSSNNIIECPFSHTCTLPVNQNSCIFPEYKACPDYQIKMRKRNSSKGKIY